MTTADRVEIAQRALHEITPAATIGDFVSETVEDDGVVTMVFAATMLGYPGWHWTVSVAELDGEAPTVLEAELLPGDGALLAPDWVPWSDRLEEYRAARAAAGEPDETIEGGVAVDDESDDDDADDEDDESDEDDDESDDDDDDDDESDGFDEDDVPARHVYDGIDVEDAIESDDDGDSDDDSVAQGGPDEADEPEADADEHRPEPEDAAGGEQGPEEDE